MGSHCILSHSTFLMSEAGTVLNLIEGPQEVASRGSHIGVEGTGHYLEVTKRKVITLIILNHLL